MEDLNQMIQGVLNNPQMMQQIMGLAGAMGAAPEAQAAPAEKQEEAPVSPDLSQMGMLSDLLKKGNIDSHQQALLNALSPYMSSSHIGKLRRAMQAAAMAELATSVLGAGKSGDSHV